MRLLEGGASRTHGLMVAIGPYPSYSELESRLSNHIGTPSASETETRHAATDRTTLNSTVSDIGGRTHSEVNVFGSSRSKICLLTERDFARHVFRAGSYECQDVLTEIDDVDLVCIKPSNVYEFKQRCYDKLIWHDFTGLVYRSNIAFEPARMAKDYEVFIAHFPYGNDLSHISAVRGWKDRCKHSVCWIDEFWEKDILTHKRWLRVLREFDHVIFGMPETAKLASDVLGRECYCVPGGVNALRFSPFPCPPERVIDVLSIGRRFEGIHQALTKETLRTNWFYVHDTFRVSDAQTFDYQQHREMYANMLKRSRYFLVAPGKMDRPNETKGQAHVGYRYYEAAAAGAIMIGQTPDSETFRAMFDWPGAVMEVKPDGSDLEGLLFELNANPEQLLELSRRNAVEALLRHDWVYRWKTILDIAGVRPTPALEIRENRLKEIASRVG